MSSSLCWRPEAASHPERTAAGAMAAEKLRDLSRPMDVPLLDATVAALYGTGSSEERHAADQISRELQNNPDMWLQVAHILQNSQNLNTKLFALQVLENVIKYKWNVLPVEQRDGIKNYISDVIVQLSGNEVSFRQERLYVNKLNIILVQVLKREWPARWTTFIPDLIAEAATSPTICENCMAILKLISEEIFDFSRGEMTQQKVKELKGSLNSEFRLIHELCLQVLPGSQRPELICATLATLHAFLSWIPIGFIFESQLLETLSKFFPIAAYRNLTLQCLTEVAALHFGDFYNTQYVQMYTVFMLQLQGILPSGTISDRYGNGSNEEQAFIQNLALFLTSFFKNHIRTLESTHDNRAALLLGLDYLIEISFLEDTEMFKVCLDYWNLFVLELFETYMERLLELQAQGIRETDDGTLIAVQQRRQLYACPLSKLRALMTCRMKKLEEVLIVEDENGNIVRETLKDNDVIGTFCEIMRETLLYLSHLDHEDTDQQKLSKQLNLEGGGEMDHSKEKLPDDKESIMLELRHELVYTTVLAELYKEDLEEAEKIIQQKDQIIESQNAQLVQGKVCTAKMVFCTCTRKSRCTTVKCSCKAANVLCCDECTCKSICLNKEPPLQRPSEKDGGRRYPSRARKKIEDRKAQDEDESDRGDSGPIPSTASDDEAVDEASASRVLEKEAAVGGEVVEAKKGAEPRKMVLDGRITKALAALFLLPNQKARMVALYSFKRLQLHNDLNELLIDDIIKCFCKEVRTNKDVVPCFLNFLICIAKETSSYKKCNSQVIRDFEGKLCASAGSVLDILDYLRRRKDLKELISNEQIAQVLSTWIPFCVSMSWNDLQKHLVVHKTLTKFLKYINWSTDVKGSSCSQSDVKEMEELKKMISELTRQSMVVMEKAIKQKDAAADDSASALRELQRQVKALQLEKKEMEDSSQRQVKALQLEKKEMEDRLLKEMEDRLQKLQIGLQEAEGYRKKLLNENLDLRGNIRVFCRVLPMMVNNIISDELSEHIEYADSIEAKGRGIIVNKKAFLFDKVFQHTTSQTTMFDEVSSLIQSALDGYKVCILSYGQTGSGKTYTMIGSEQQKGITPRSLEKIFNCESAENKSCKYSFEVSIFEIYNNEVKDLLSPRPADLLIPRKLKPNGETGEIQGLVVEEIFSSQHALDLLATATSNRSVAETTMNEHSSRSHLFFNLKITGINEGQKVRGRLSLVDLAGSERVANNDNNHDRVTEGNNINVSLMHLGTVIQAIATKAPHIPFRNCVLTHVLKDYLEGDSKMLMLANIAQEKSSIEETISTLKFASDVNATNIKYIHMMPTCGKGEKSVAGKPPKTPHPSKRKVGFH